jgi:hypothetical protein
MGAHGKNFYNTLARRYGFEDAAERIQDLYLDGKKDEAAVAVPDELVRGTSLIGPESYVTERLAAFAQAGVSTLLVQPLASDGRDGWPRSRSYARCWHDSTARRVIPAGRKPAPEGAS